MSLLPGRRWDAGRGFISGGAHGEKKLPKRPANCAVRAGRGMAQLTDDCFAFSGPLLPLADMERLIAERVQPVAETETVPLAAARGRILSGDIVASIDLPSFDNSAVDGYAVRGADIPKEGEARLRVYGRVMAGHSFSATVGGGEAVRVFTGAPMPAGADTVFMQEDVSVEGDTVTVPAGLKPGSNRRLAGEDIRGGSIALPKGRVLTEQDVALAGAIGLNAIVVTRNIRVALFSTGDEIVEPGAALAPAKLFDANRFLLSGLLQRFPTSVTDLGILPDKREILAREIGSAAKAHDIVLTSGGVSTGEADHVRAAVEDIGKLVFWRIGIKPGRPMAMGTIDGAAFAGLPGNPAAVFVTFGRVVLPLLFRLAGAERKKSIPLPVRAAFAYKKKSGRKEYVRVSLRRAPDGVIEAVKHPQDGAGVITSLTETDGLLELDESITTVEAGSTVGFLSYDNFLR